MDISRRSFLSGAALLGTASAIGALSGCAPKTEEGNAQSTTTETTDTPTTHNPASTESYDLVVVGSGTAGMSAAARAAELGAKVIVLEKNPFLGGSSAYAEGIGGVNSYLHRQEGITIDNNEVFLATQEYHHWAADSVVLRRFIEESGPTLDWLHDNCGINFAKATVTAPTSYPSWHLATNAAGEIARNSESVIAPLEAYCATLGVTIKVSCPATDLMVSNGNVSGVYFTEGKEEHAIESKAVILATGGYSNNEEMFEEFAQVPFDRIYNWGAAGRDGDGIGWALELGAATHIPSTVMYSCSRVPEAASFEEKVNWVFSWQPNLRVNQTGERFINESLSADFARISNAILAQTTCYSLMDQAYVDLIANTALPVGLDSLGYVAGQPLPGTVEAIEGALKENRIIKADTLEDLAKQLNLDTATLKATVEEYNGFADSGMDPKFGVPAPLMSALTTPPFYASEIMPACFTSVGGLRVDEDMRVLTTEGEAIEGLYAIGGDASSDTGRDYDVAVMSGSQQGWCAAGGRLAAQHIFA